MQKIYLVFGVLALLVFGFSCKPNISPNARQELGKDMQGSINRKSNIKFDSSQISTFFKTYPELAKYEKEVKSIYRKYNFNHIWFDNNGIIEFGNSLYSKVNKLDKEGIMSVFPYHDKIAGVFEDDVENTLSNTETEIMLTNLFLFYAEKVYQGIDFKTTTVIEWLLPRKEISYHDLLDSVMLDPAILKNNEQVLFFQYNKLREALQKYREIEKNGGWNPIDIVPKVKSYKPGDTSQVILQLRERLFITGDIPENNKSNKYDDIMVAGVKKYQLRNGKNLQSNITPALIEDMNVPIGERIKTIMINMERCRWISPDVIKADELIFVNIPSYMLYFRRGGQRVFESPVVVGRTMTKTVIFSGNMSSIVFSPYWNVPTSILEKEIKPGIKKDPDYLDKHNMEWYNGQVRQKPGEKNSLGQVKFLFPNSNNIYLHDTPSKSLFGKEDRAFSHGCIRVGKPRDLAVKIMENDPEWTPEKIDQAMNAGKEKWYTLKTKIPVYIGYFTAWVNDQGEINFYNDVYKQDNRLFSILVGNDLASK